MLHMSRDLTSKERRTYLHTLRKHHSQFATVGIPKGLSLRSAMDNTVLPPSEGPKAGQGTGTVAPPGPNCSPAALGAQQRQPTA